MVAWLLYLGVTVTAGFGLSFVVGLLKASKSPADHNFCSIAFFSFLLTIGGPFAYVEGLTILKGKELEASVKHAYEDSPLEGKMLYFKVKSYSNDQAKALAVGEERTIWGGLDHPVMEITMAKKSGKWEATGYRVLESEKLNRDGLIFPPYH